MIWRSKRVAVTNRAALGHGDRPHHRSGARAAGHALAARLAAVINSS
jgi:hypothetical protein